MTRIFQSSWLAVLVGGLLYFGTTLAILRPAKFAGLNLSRQQIELSAADDPSWKFRNPEFNQWVAQIKEEKDALALRTQQLDELQNHIAADRQEINIVTQTVAQMQADFDKNVIRFKAQETENVRHQAKLIAAMSPEGSAALVRQMSDDDVVRILFIMKTDQASLILDNLSKLGAADARRAALLTVRLQQVLPEASNTTVSTTSP
jgi:flagellar motility protein MotE (MotC chaperone)